DALRDELYLASLVPERPKLDPLAPGSRVVREDRGAMLSRADAEPAVQLVGVAAEHRRHHVLDYLSRLGAGLGDPSPHRGEPVREVVGIASPLLKLFGERDPRSRKVLRGRVVAGGEPAVGKAGDPAQAGLRSPTADPDRDTVLPVWQWRQRGV